MVGAAAAALTIYDMVKGAERGVEVLAVRLEKSAAVRAARGDAQRQRPGARAVA